MRVSMGMGVLLALSGCARAAPSVAQPAASPPVEPSTSADPCDSESTTLAIESCVTTARRQLEAEIQASLTRVVTVLRAHGVADADPLVSASQSDWERYRSSHCQLFEKLSEGGNMARVAGAYCRRDIAQARLSSLRSLEQSLGE